MNINRHNYEEYFLLYVDNELKQDERIKVESFIQQNPDLVNELEMLKQAVLEDGEIKFESKGLLYKKDEGINLSNYEDYFLLLVDEELNEKNTHEVEKFVLMHPEVQDEFTLLKSVKLEPELLQFKNKQSLYRLEEKKQRRIVPMVWMRMSAAAVILGLIAAMWIFNQNSKINNPEHGIAATTKRNDVQSTHKNADLVDKPVTQSTTNAMTENITEQDLQQEVMGKKRPEAAFKQLASNSGKKQIKQSKALPNQGVVAHNEAFLPEKNSVATNNLPVVERRIEKNDENETTTQPGRLSTYQDDNSFAANSKPEKTASVVSNAFYREIDTNEDERNINIGSGSINKNKIKALFKRAAGFLGKNIDKNDEPASVRVAGFQIKGR